MKGSTAVTLLCAYEIRQRSRIVHYYAAERPSLQEVAEIIATPRPSICLSVRTSIPCIQFLGIGKP